jgi:4-amino-4-deoxy-L-arabinose transferase-like glycosyltransferase
VLQAVRRWAPVLGPALLAALLACWSLGYGLPFEFRPDEDVMVGHSVRMAATGSLDPLFANYPPLVFYLLAALEKATGNAGATPADPTAAYLVARGLSAAADAVTAALSALAGLRAYGARAAAVAGLVAAAAPLATRQAHFGTTDFVQAALVAGALAAALFAARPRGFLLAGALCGLAAAAKYTGGLAAVAVLVLAWRSPLRLRSLAAALGGAAVAFAVPGSVILLHPSDYLNGFLFLGGRAYGSAFQLPRGWLYFPLDALPYCLGLGAYPLALAGIAAAAWRRSAPDLALLAFVLAYYAITGAGRENFFRYLLPLVPPLSILAGGAVAAAPARLAPAVLALALLLLLPGLYASVETDLLLGTVDSRVLAARWLEANAAAGSVLKQPYYGGPFYSDRIVEQNRTKTADQAAASWLQGRFTASFDVEDEATGGPPPDYELLATAFPGQGRGAWPGAAFTVEAASGPAVYDPIDAFYLPVWGFWNVQRPGPSLAIIRR